MMQGKFCGSVLPLFKIFVFSKNIKFLCMVMYDTEHKKENEN